MGVDLKCTTKERERVRECKETMCLGKANLSRLPNPFQLEKNSDSDNRSAAPLFPPMRALPAYLTGFTTTTLGFQIMVLPEVALETLP